MHLAVGFSPRSQGVKPRRVATARTIQPPLTRLAINFKRHRGLKPTAKCISRSAAVSGTKKAALSDGLSCLC